MARPLNHGPMDFLDALESSASESAVAPPAASLRPPSAKAKAKARASCGKYGRGRHGCMGQGNRKQGICHLSKCTQLSIQLSSSPSGTSAERAALAACMREAKAARRALRLRSQAGRVGKRKRHGRFSNDQQLLNAAYKGDPSMARYFARQVRLYVAAAFMDTQLAFLRSLADRASSQQLVLLATRVAWDETTQRLTAVPTHKLAAEQGQGAFSTMIVSLELTLVWGGASRGSSASRKPEPEAQTQTFKLVIPPVLLQRGTAAQSLWEGLFGHPDMQAIWNQWQQLAEFAQHVMTVVETDAAGVNDRVFAGGVVAFRILTIFIAIPNHLPKS